MSEASLSEYELNEMHKGLLRTMDRAKNGKKFKTELVDALTKGFPIDHKYGSDTLLHRSLSDNHNITQILLDLGADVNVEDHNGMNALTLAAYNFRYGNFRENERYQQSPAQAYKNNSVGAILHEILSESN